jgi:hypothetical protein
VHSVNVSCFILPLHWVRTCLIFLTFHEIFICGDGLDHNGALRLLINCGVAGQSERDSVSQYAIRRGIISIQHLCTEPSAMSVLVACPMQRVSESQHVPWFGY